MLKPIFVVAALCMSASAWALPSPLFSSQTYASQLGVGMVVDWARTERGIREFDPLVVRDFQQRGIGHVEIRVGGAATHQRLIHLQKIVEACQRYNIVPIVSYEADELKASTTAQNEAEVVAWWTIVARYFAQSDPRLGFDIFYEPSEKLTRTQLNNLYDKTAKAIHKISPQRMVFITPHARGVPENLPGLKWPESNHTAIIAAWHIFPYTLAVNGKRLWTTGTVAEKAAITVRINNVVRWQQKTGHSSWVGAWSVGEIVKNSPREQQLSFTTFVACELQKAHIPYAVNGDIKFYDGEEGAWRPEMQPLLDALLNPQCDN